MMTTKRRGGIYLELLPVWVDAVLLLLVPCLIVVCLLLPEQKLEPLYAAVSGLLAWVADIGNQARKSDFPNGLALSYGLALYGGLAAATVSAFAAKRSNKFRGVLRRTSLKSRYFVIVLILVLPLPLIFGGMSEGARASTRAISYWIVASPIAAAAYCMIAYWMAFMACSYLHFELSIFIDWVQEKIGLKQAEQ